MNNNISKPKNLLDYLGYHLSKQTRLQISLLLLAFQLMLGYSYMGFITIPPISITTLTSVVILTAILLGPIEASVQGILFGISSMWQATTSGVSAGDVLFAPTLSGAPTASVVLAVGTRVAFGLSAAILARLVFINKPKCIIPWLVLVSVISQLLHTVYVYAAMEHYFPATGVKTIYAFTNLVSWDHFVTYGFTVLLVIILVVFMRNKFIRQFLEIADDRPSTLDRSEYYGIAALLIFTVFSAVASFSHMLQRMSVVFVKTGADLTSETKDLTNMVFYQFMASLIGTIIILYIVFSMVKWYYANRDRSRLEETNHQLQLSKEEAEDAQRKAEAASQAKSSFLFNMSHDIRTPLNAIIGFTELAGLHADNRELAQEYRQKVTVASKQLADILNNVLEMARIENKKVVIEEELADIEELFASTAAIFESETSKKNQKLHLSMDMKHRYLYLDKTHMSEVVMNVISNAIKYTPEEGDIYVSFRELPGKNENECLAESTVRDTGIGMSEEFVAQIFDQFSRERNSSQSGIQGTGLGMAIVKNLVELMGGTITINSKIGEGTEIKFVIPHRIGEAPEQTDTVDISNTKDLLEGKRILLAEDIDVNAMLIEEILQMNGMTSERARDGLECVSKIKDAASGYYDLILMDIQMPNLNGYDATRQIRSIDDDTKASIPIIALSANAFKEDVLRSLEAGMNGHLAKPIDMDALIAKLSEIIADHQTMTLNELLRTNDIDLNSLINSDSGIYCTDSNRRIIFWNSAAAKITGHTEEHVKGKHCFYSGLKHEDKQCKQLCDERCPLIEAIIEGKERKEEVSVLCNDGTRRWINIESRPLYANGEVHGGIEYFTPSESDR